MINTIINNFHLNNFLFFLNINNELFNRILELKNITEILSITLFITGLTLIAFNLSNLIITLIGVELLLLAANINFLVTAVLNEHSLGLVYSLSVLTISAVETAIGAGLLIVCYSIKKTVEFQDLNKLKD